MTGARAAWWCAPFFNRLTRRLRPSQGPELPTFSLSATSSPPPGRTWWRGICAGSWPRENIHLTIANGENAAGGFGITPPLADELFGYGVDVLTSGNHIWDKREIYDYLPRQPRLLRPANYVEELPGSGVVVVEARNGVRCAVINLQGRVLHADHRLPFSQGRRAARGAAGGGQGALRRFSRRAHQRKDGHGLAPGRPRLGR